MQNNSSSKQGQALPEYLPLVAMIAIASLVILGLFGDTLQQQFSHVATELAGKKSTNSQPSQTPSTPTTTPTTTPTNTPTTEPITSPTDPVKCESHWTDDKYQSRECNGRWYCGLQKFTDEIKAAANVIYDFFEGVASGIGDQLKGLWDLLKDPTVLYDVAKAFIDDPKGTIETIVKGLGDDVERVLECGPKDVGKVIGQYASPAMALKVLTKVAKIIKSKKLTKYVDEIECGFASFAAGTTIWTEKGQVVIDDIQVGQSVYSRNKNNHKDQYQKVTKTLGRTAPGYYLLTTEFETLKVTEEHPLWLQGKGWTKVSEITVNDVIASLDGDVLILDNKKVETPLQVYNFSVANTPNYFVGESKLWAHNAKVPCKFKATNNPNDYLDHALKRQGLNRLPDRYKEKWSDDKFNYEVRAHEANPVHGKIGTIYRVSRKTIPESGKQGSGLEYMDKSGDWHHESTLKETFKDGTKNPKYNAQAAADTHIQYTG